MKSLFKVTVLVSLISFTCIAESTVTTGKIQAIGPNEYDVFFIYMNAPPSGTVPACAVTGAANNRYAIRPSAPGGRAMIAALLLAFANDKTITVFGRGSYPTAYTGSQFCDVVADTETLNYLHIER